MEKNKLNSERESLSHIVGKCTSVISQGDVGGWDGSTQFSEFTFYLLTALSSFSRLFFITCACKYLHCRINSKMMYASSHMQTEWANNLHAHHTNDWFGNRSGIRLRIMLIHSFMEILARIRQRAGGDPSTHNHYVCFIIDGITECQTTRSTASKYCANNHLRTRQDHPLKWHSLYCALLKKKKTQRSDHMVQCIEYFSREPHPWNAIVRRHEIPIWRRRIENNKNIIKSLYW